MFCQQPLILGSTRCLFLSVALQHSSVIPFLLLTFHTRLFVCKGNRNTFFIFQLKAEHDNYLLYGSAPLLLVRQRASISQQLFASHSNQDGPQEEKSSCNLVHPIVLFLLEVGEGEGGAGVDRLTSIKKFQVQFSQWFFSISFYRMSEY